LKRRFYINLAKEKGGKEKIAILKNILF